MAILICEKTPIVVQGITGRQGRFHTKKMLEYGANIVAGVAPGRGGEEVHGVSVYNSCLEAFSEHSIEASIVFVPAPYTKAAVYEAIDASVESNNSLKHIVIITEGIPVHDSAQIMEYADANGIKIIGPNCPGIIVPESTKIGIIPGEITKRGPVGVVSRSGTLTYEIVKQLTNAGIGQSTCIGIGGDPVHGLGFIEVLDYFENDDETKAIVLIGEIGGNEEERAARHVREHIHKPVIAFIAGRSAPPGKQMGHAGAIVSGTAGTASEKIRILRENGVEVVERPSQIPMKVKKYIA